MGAAVQAAVDDDLPVPAQSFGGLQANSATGRAAQAAASGVLAVVEASPEQRDAFKSRLTGVSVRWDSDAEAFGKLARESVEAVLTAQQLAVVRSFGDEGDVARPSVLLLRGLGVDDDLPLTTVAQEHAMHVAALRKQGGSKVVGSARSRLRKEGQVSEAWTVGILGMWPETDSFYSPTIATPHGYVADHVSTSVKFGINQVVPLQGKETMFANYGSRVNLSWHRDGGADVLGQEHEHTLPSKVALFCLRHDHDQMAETHFVDNRMLCASLAPRASHFCLADSFPSTKLIRPRGTGDLEVLTTQPVLFKMRDADNVARTSGAAEGLTPFQLDDDTLLAADKHRLFFKKPHPCIGGTPEWPIVSIQQDREVDTSLSDPCVAAAYARMCEAASEVGFALKLRQGDLCIVNNNGALHGRSAYSPRFDGEDRWLQRLSTHKMGAQEADARMKEVYFRENFVAEMQATQRLLKQHADQLSELEQLKAIRQQAQSEGGGVQTAMFGALAGALAAAGLGLIRSRL